MAYYMFIFWYFYCFKRLFVLSSLIFNKDYYNVTQTNKFTFELPKGLNIVVSVD